MIKTALAALAVLSLIPSAAMAAQANLSKTPTSTLTYTIRGRDTAPTDILSMGGASSCSVQTSLSGAAAVSIAPRPNPSVSHTSAPGVVSITTSGASTFTSDAGQFSVSFGVTSNSANVTISCTPGGGGASGIDGSYNNTTSGLAATTLQGAVDELEASKAEVTSQTSVLLQGQNGIAAVSDPNDITASPDVVCGTATPGSCLFISDKGIEFVNTSLTKWRAVAAKHYDFIYENISDESIGAIDGTNCLGNPWANLGDRGTACNNQKTTIRAVTDITLDTFTVFAHDVGGSAITLRGCAICISLDGGSTCAAGSDVSLPSADGITLAEGQTNTKTLNIQIAKGDFFQFYSVNGEFSGAGGEGVCTSLASQHLGVNLEFYER